MREPRIPWPFAGREGVRMRRLLWASGGVTAFLFVVLFVIDQQMRGTGGPGIIALEVAGGPGRASVILADWGPDGIGWARASLIVDFPFLIAYAVFFSAACTAIGRRLREVAVGEGSGARLAAALYAPAPWIGWAFIAAAAFDVVENLALIRVIDYNLTPWAHLSQLMAAPKFGIFVSGLTFLVVALILVYARRPKE